MSKQQPYILWLPSWYPNQLQPFDGDFIQRHAYSVSSFHNVHVLFLVRDEKMLVTKNVKIDEKRSNSLIETIVYYAVGNVPMAVQRLISGVHYFRHFKKLIKCHIKEFGKPALVHVHVTLKAGIFAKWLHYKYGIPYIISEHWTGLLSEAEVPFTSLPVYWQQLAKLVWKGAHSISVVSNYLYGHLKKLAPKTSIRVIPNVVDTTIFNVQPPEQRNAGMNFIHISGFGYQKNFEGILQAFALLKAKSYDVRLDVFGPLQPAILSLIKQLQLSDVVFLYGEVSQAELAIYLKKAAALILYSRYETFGCVVIEATACGVPVIASDIPVLHEILNEGENGTFVAGENPVALAEKLAWFIRHRSQFNAQAIAQHSKELYNYKTVGLQFSQWYAAVLNETRN